MRKTILILALATSAITAAAQGAQTTPAAPPPPRGNPMMRADANGDGVVTRAEAIAEADQRFAMMDTNRDGQFSADEMQAARGMMRERMEARGGADRVPAPRGAEHAPGMGRHADPDGSGTISKAEWEARAGTRFDRMDANRDGTLDSAELAAMPGMRGGRRDMRDATMPPPLPPPGQ